MSVEPLPLKPGEDPWKVREISPDDFPWKRSRSGFAVFFFFSLLVAFTLLRLVLFLRFGLHEPWTLGSVVSIFLIGFQQDFLVALGTALPLFFWNWIVPDKLFRSWPHRILFIGGFFLFWFVQIFLLFVEYYFFDEFKSRFTTVAVDYLTAPKEVAGNIWESYNVVLVVAICLVIAILWMVTALVYFRQMWFQPVRARSRIAQFAIAVVLFFGVWVTLNPQFTVFADMYNRDWSACMDWVTSTTDGTHFSTDRTLNEIADNGSISFVNAALTRNLDYSAYYQTMPKAAAYRRVRQLLAMPGADMTSRTNSILRHIQGDPAKPKLNVVILMEESLGSEFWGCLGRTNTLTPHMDELATNEGILFTNIYASGNRTVRGFEGVLASFPPLPGDSIVKRDHSDNVETIARVLKRDGYNSIFLYGGRGMFDSMKSFTMDNGWDRFLEHNPPFNDDFPHPMFANIWGVCDEEVFARAIQEFRELNKTGKPFLGTIMTVSNHKPYTYPPGRIPEGPPPGRHPHAGLWHKILVKLGIGTKPGASRNKAVEYSDWCLGQFFDAAKKEPFWTNTVFVVVADHGARVYGSQSIPIFSYEIPLVILGPAVVKAPLRNGQLGCSLDVAPTVLGLLGRPYDSMFFGRNLLKEPKPNDGRVFINHNRDIGIMEDQRLAVLGLQKTEEYYSGDPKVANMEPLSSPQQSDLEIKTNAIAIYQVADDLYMHERYRIDAGGATRPSTLTTTNAPTAKP
ncbi:MAG TPA: LTA synthase family protein [Candidatus Angelobacter sp.]|nr:LTA synthase family protein [Candidatus Angelobacter sp.]